MTCCRASDRLRRLAAKAPTTRLYRDLLAARPAAARAAQAVYDAWDPDDESDDHEGGGICDDVARALADVVAAKIPYAETTDGGQDGDDHAYVVVYDAASAYAFDISPHVYERGGGYAWTKRPGVTLTPDDVDVVPLDRADLDVG